jgi:hypothetical protein
VLDHSFKLERKILSNSKKIIVRIWGGIGNQLFCYAAARRLAIMNGAELVIDNVSGFEHDYLYKRTYQLDHFDISSRKANRKELLYPLPRVRRSFIKRFNKFLPYPLRSYISQDGIEFDPRLLKFSLKKDLYLEGYWQSEKYFKDIESILRSDLRITPPIDQENLSMAYKISDCRSVAVHYRFFDSPGQDGVNNISSDYYEKAFKRIKLFVPDAHFFIFSDRLDAAKSEISLPSDQLTFVEINQGDENAYADLWLMTKCENFIIANSTFSWWGAWLSINSHKIVIAPGFVKKTGSMCWGFSGLLPDDWIKL